MAIQGRFKNIFSRLELCIKIFYYSRKTLRISVTFIGVGVGVVGAGSYSTVTTSLLMLQNLRYHHTEQ